MTKLSLTPPALTKTAIAKAGADFAEAILDDGNVDILTAFMRLRAVSDAANAALNALLIDARDEAEKYPPADRERLGVKFKTGGGYELWDYSHDNSWQFLKEQEKVWADKRKERERYLKVLKEEVIVRDTGEVVTPAVVKGYAKQSLALTFPKE